MADSSGSESLERELLLATLELPTQERDSYLENACAGHPGLKARILRLLRNAEPGDDFMGSPAVDMNPTQSMNTIDVGRQIGRYRLREQIGEGGMGVVFVAEQTEPISRKVALKVIKPGMDSKVVIARFEAERQALAMMDHPNIARVLDAGTTAERLPYFVMELVRGMAITKYCDQAKASIADRLRLFLDVCNAVQHAHQKGIIHRDLKPSNILVTLHDGKPVVKVIDFGVAKALHQSLTEHTVYTALNQVLGTPLYMSPEQLELSGMDIDTRSDIYSLGVLLYELLSGTLPFERDRLLKSGFDEMRRIIREEDPPRPSQRVTSMAKEVVSTVAETRGLDQRELQKTIQSELDWIALKSLSKDRSRRYGSAAELASDIQRFLDDVPVLACPPSFAYLAKKFCRKHRSLILFASILSLSLIVGTAVSVQQAIRATQAETEVGKKLNEVTLEQSKTSRALTAVKVAEAEQRRLRQEAEEAANKASEAAANEKKLRQQTEASNREAQWNLYVANLSGMQTALDERDFGLLDRLLRASTPTENEIDFRGWEWFYLEQCAKSASHLLPQIENQFSRGQVAFNPVADELATFTSPHFIDIWDPNSRKHLRRFKCEKGIANFSWSHDGKYLAIGTSASCECVFLDSSTGTEIWIAQPFANSESKGLTTSIGGLCWSPDSQTVAIGTAYGDISLLDLRNRTAKTIFTAAEQSFLSDISWHPHDDRILVGMRFGRRMILNTQDQSKVDLTFLNSEIGTATAWSPSGCLLVTSEASDIRIATDQGEEVGLLQGHDSTVTDLAWLDDRIFFSVSKDKTVRMWDAESKTELRSWSVIDTPIFHLSISASRQKLAIGSNWPSRIFDILPPVTHRLQKLSFDGPPMDLKWSPDGSKLYAYGNKPQGETWIGASDLLDGLTLRLIGSSLNESGQRGGAWFPDSRFVLRALDGNQIQVGDPRLGLGLQRVKDIQFTRSNAIWSPSCKLLMINNSDPPIALRNGRTLEIQRTWSVNPPNGSNKGAWAPSESRFLVGGGCFPVVLHVDGKTTPFPEAQSFLNYGIAWHPSERILALGNDAGDISVFESDSLKRIQFLTGHSADIQSLDFSPDGSRLVSASYDRTVRIWDVATGRELIRLKSPNGSGFKHVCWSPDGQQLAGATLDGNAVLFGPPGMAIPPTVAAVPTHGKIFEVFARQGAIEQLRSIAPQSGWRPPYQQLNQILDNLDQGAQPQLAEEIHRWFEPCKGSAESFENHCNAIVRFVDGYLDGKQAVATAEKCLGILKQVPGTIERRKYLYWQNEIRFALVYRLSAESESSEFIETLKTAREAETQFSTEFELHSQDWYRRLSLETLQISTAVNRHIKLIEASDDAVETDTLRNLFSEHEKLLGSIPVESMPLQVPVDARSIRDDWIRTLSQTEVRRGRKLTFEREWPDSISREILVKTDIVPYYFLGVSQLVIGDRAGHEETCKRMLQRFGATTDDPQTASLLVWTACLSPSSFSDFEAVLKYYQQTAPAKSESIEKGALYYRMGEFEQAKNSLTKASKSFRSQSNTQLIETLLFLALTELKLKNRESAEIFAAEAIAMVNQRLAEPEARKTNSWQRIAQWRLLQAELQKTREELINE